MELSIFDKNDFLCPKNGFLCFRYNKGMVTCWPPVIATSRPSDPVDFEIFTGDGYQNFLTKLSDFSPGSNIETIMDDVRKWPGMAKVAGDFPAGIFLHRGFPRWVLFLPRWKPAGHLAGT